jgi:death on curing protein
MNWISKSTALKIHDEILAELGGLAGVRDESGLESALARPQQKYNYGETNVARLAASLMYGLVQGHAYSDGNKRTSFICTNTFLNDNGYTLRAPAKEIFDTLIRS